MSRREEIIEAELKNAIPLANGAIDGNVKLSAALYNLVPGTTDKGSPNSIEKTFSDFDKLRWEDLRRHGDEYLQRCPRR